TARFLFTGSAATTRVNRVRQPSSRGAHRNTTMQVLRNKAFSLAALGLFTGFSASAMQGCDPDNGLCGPCGSVLEGSVSIVNNARVDGFFRAIADLNGVFVRVNADFEANIRALAEVWGYGEANAEINADFVAGLM